MILIALVALCVLTVPLTGGKLTRLGELQLRWVWMAPAALSLQVLIVTIAPGGNTTVHALIHVGTYALLVIFLWTNRKLPGAWVIGAGTLANTAAILANGGVMPASRTAQRLAGLSEGAGFHNSALLSHPHLLWLGDIIPAPGPLPNVLSVGDCLVFMGLLVLLHRTCRTEAVDADRARPAGAINADPARPAGDHLIAASREAGSPI